MKVRYILLLILLSFGFKNSFSQTRYALIVAIGNYPDPKKNIWPVINSTNDVPLIKNALMSGLQFNEKNIRVLIDSQATREGILDAMDKLYADVKPGDIVVIHFSSHGIQLQDDNNDEIDGLDECIVPYGAIYSPDPDKFGELSKGYIRDDLFGDKITQLRNKLGKEGDILVTLDACHSGSGTRGAQTSKIRGGNPSMVSRSFNPAAFSGVDSAGVFKENEGTKLNADASSMVLISGAQAREVNYECYDDNNNPVGSLSYSFSKAITSLKGNITYRGLFAMIENIMIDKARNQKPVLEGDGIDRELFGGKYENQQAYFSIDQRRSNAKQIILKAGFISGITSGSLINFYELGTNNTQGKKPIGSGKVINSTSFTATVQLDSPDAGLAKKNPWAFIKELSYGSQKLKLMVKGNKAAVKMVTDSLKDFQLVEFSDNCDLYLDTAGSVSNWALKYPNTGIVFRDGLDFLQTKNMSGLKSDLKSFDRFRYLKGLMFSEANLSAKVELVFLDKKGKIDSARIASRTHLGRLELRENDEVFLKVTNTGIRDFYINVVDIQPDGLINAIIPNKNVKDSKGNFSPIKWEDCLVHAVDSVLFSKYSISIQKPFGEECFKIFLSASPLDLEDILTSRDEKEAVGKRGVLNGLEKIFVNSNINEAGKRGGTVTTINTDQNGTISSLNFQIVPDK